MYSTWGKRAFDVGAAVTGLLLMSPLLLLVMATIRLHDRGPAIFRQTRVGKNGQLFTMFKLRSMAVGSVSVPSTQAACMRVTPIGAIIRRLNIDELPQLVNVLKGDMSLIGPRPALPSQEALCRLRLDSGALTCRPGLTGLAQVNAFDGMPEDTKARWDAQYATRLSLTTDLRIVLRTLSYLTRKPPVY